MKPLDVLELLLVAGAEVLKLVNSGAPKADVLARVRSLREDAARIDGDVDELARPRTAEARRREEASR